MAVKTYSYAKHKKVQISQHFYIGEFGSYNAATHELTSDTILINDDLPKKLEELYSYLKCGKMVITSGCRSKDFEYYLSKKYSGQHVLGNAADIVCYDSKGKVIDPKTVCCAAQAVGFKGIGYMRGATHVDVRDTKSWFDETKNCLSVGDWYLYFKVAKPSVAPSTPVNTANPVPAAAQQKVYTVVKGDTLSSIAKKYGTTYQKLAKYNGISNPNKISVGQKIKIPN